MKELTIITPTYNRSDYLERVYRSICKQDFTDLTWLIIDDGSIDNTQETVKRLQKENIIEIEYFKKENEGKHVALNFAYEKLNSKYCIILDSDDELVSDSLGQFVNLINNSDESVWSVIGRCVNSQTGSLVGTPWCEKINELSPKERLKEIYRTKGEKIAIQKVDVVKKFPFPIYDDTNFVSEGMTYRLINHKYDSLCSDYFLRIYHTETEESLTNDSKTLQNHSQRVWNTFYHYSIDAINHFLSDITFDFEIAFCIVNVSRCAIMSQRKYLKVMKELNGIIRKILVSVAYPVSYIFCAIFYKKK